MNTPNETQPNRPSQTKPRQTARRHTQRNNAKRKRATRVAMRTTHPLRRVCGSISTRTSPSTRSHPSPECPPLNTTIDEIAYHTPAAAGRRKAPKEQQKLLFCAKTPCRKKGRAQPPATRNPIQESSARTPARTQRRMKYGTTHPLRRVSPRCTKPHLTRTLMENRCGSHPQPDPRTRDREPKRVPHTRFGGIQIQAPEMTTCDPRLVQTTCPTVNRRAQPPVPHTRPSGTTPAQAGVVLLSNSTIHPLGWAQGVY
ncbi:hypothetical protein BS47DRAFT_1368783 [Hydnum rufescens UP504]|uniref:Uncharacterized protein n=1 Tax=Hydnum rufescens UP504 TaxID=1448309 RepID=A0A9P6AEL1_9AGAM|nr:hypothetical protein BS47DRAFT_1368783 [Hydnum rufescens UP504]